MTKKIPSTDDLIYGTTQDSDVSLSMANVLGPLQADIRELLTQKDVNEWGAKHLSKDVIDLLYLHLGGKGFIIEEYDRQIRRYIEDGIPSPLK